MNRAFIASLGLTATGVAAFVAFAVSRPAAPIYDDVYFEQAATEAQQSRADLAKRPIDFSGLKASTLPTRAKADADICGYECQAYRAAPPAQPIELHHGKDDI